MLNHVIVVLGLEFGGELLLLGRAVCPPNLECVVEPAIAVGVDDAAAVAAAEHIRSVNEREGINRIDSGRGKLRVVRFADAQKLVKEGSNLYLAGEAAAAQPDTTAKIRQGFIEKSNINSVTEMSRMIEITRTYTQISSLLQQQGDLHKSAIDIVGDGLAARLDAHLPIAQPTDEWAVVGRYSDLAVKQR